MQHRSGPLRTLVGLIGAFGLVVAACGGGSDVTKEDLVTELVGENLFTQEQAECFVDRIWDDIGPLDADTLTGDGELTDEQTEVLATATLACIDLGDVSGSDTDSSPLHTDSSPGDPPPGTDATLDALWVACGAGDAEACDDLFFDSPSGSDYESFGLTCGGRGLGDCVEVIGSSD